VRDPSKRVVITGIGCCTVFGNDPDKFYEKWALLRCRVRTLAAGSNQLL